MSEKHLLILERSSQNLQKITRNGKTMLEGIFAEFGVENRNGRIYEEKEYLPHLEYLKKDIANGNLLGELDHPERFEVALGNVSHRVTELWYDQQSRQIKGRIEIIEGTPKGQIAKSLLEAGVPLSISSRAAGTVNEDKTVAIQQIYTYDLVAKPGFESAQLHKVNESANPQQDEINQMIQELNESFNSRKEHSINSQFGLINENISIIDLTDKFPKLKLREEAKKLIKNNPINQMADKTLPSMNENSIEQLSLFVKEQLSAINTRLDQIQENSNTKDLSKIKTYVEKLRKIQENSLDWQSQIAKAVNEVAQYADTLADKSNKHYKLTKKIIETVDHNAKTLNATQDWTSEVAKVTNAIGETVDHNALMLNGINEWTGEIAKSVNKLNEWNEEIAPAVNDMHEWVGTQAKAINGIHEWTSSIAKNLNRSLNWSEDMFGRAISKEEAMKIIDYVELVSESKSNPELRAKIDEMLSTHSITEKPLNESKLKGLNVIDSVSKIGDTHVDTEHTKNTSVSFDPKTKTIIAKLRNIKLSKEKMPLGDDSLQMNPEKTGGKLPNDSGLTNDPNSLKTNLKTVKTHGSGKESISNDGPKNQNQNFKLNVKPHTKSGFANETLNIKTRKSNLDETLSKIINTLEKEKKVDESIKSEYPFTQLLSENDRNRFAALDATDKQKVAEEIQKVPTTDSKVIIKLWENALQTNKIEEPLWLTLAPKIYKDAYTKSSDIVKENINAKAEFFNLSTQYQIDNFWETSGIITKPTFVLNESVSAVNPVENEQKLDSYVAQVGEQMKRYM